MHSGDPRLDRTRELVSEKRRDRHNASSGAKPHGPFCEASVREVGADCRWETVARRRPVIDADKWATSTWSQAEVGRGVGDDEVAVAGRGWEEQPGRAQLAQR